MKILIVDDLKENLLLLDTLLKGSGYEVEQASNGKDALHKLKTGSYQMVISDILMPVMDGFNLCREVRKDEALSSLPFVFYTATYTDPRDEEFALKLGADRYLIKPMDPVRLLSAIREVLSGCSQRKPGAIGLLSVDREAEYFRNYSEVLVRKLEDKVELFRTIFTLDPSALLLLSTSNTILELNQTAENMLGVSAPEALDKNFIDCFIPEVRRAAFIEQIKTSLAGSPVYYFEGAVRSVGGSERTLLWNAQRLMRVSAVVEGVLLIGYDITERKRAEEELRESEERYRTLFADAKDGIALADAETGMIVDCNNALCRTVEREKDELVGRMQSLLHPQQRPIDGQTTSIAKHKTEETGMLHEDQLVSKSGKLIPVEIKAARVRITGHDYLLGIFRDISDRERLEREKETLRVQFIQAQKLEAVGTLAGGVAHDFNNLLTAIGGFIDLAMMRLEDSDPIKNDLKQASNTAIRAGKVVRQLLLFSRKQPMQPSALDFNAVIMNLLKMLQRLIGEDIAIDTELAPDLWTVQGDEGNIEQVIMNLTVNARDAMPQGGRIIIKTENVHIKEDYCRNQIDVRPGAFICLTITDTGTGMDAATIERIFEPFFSTKAKDKGTGLGLPVVSDIVKQHHGWIDVESTPGRGTAFKIFLPASHAVPARKIPGKTDLKNYRGKGERILVIEDQVEIRELSAEALTLNGYTVFPSENARKARELFAREKGDFALVFSDIMLPDISGIKLVEELSSGREFPRIFSSGYAEDKAGFGILKEKGYRFLQKPYTLESLLKAVREVLEST